MILGVLAYSAATRAQQNALVAQNDFLNALLDASPGAIVPLSNKRQERDAQFLALQGARALNAAQQARAGQNVMQINYGMAQVRPEAMVNIISDYQNAFPQPRLYAEREPVKIDGRTSVIRKMGFGGK